MDEKVFGVPTGYRIIEFLGEGLNSCVYRAIKENSKHGIKFEVALKILKSENLTSLWKNEFERLSLVRSKYCAQLLGWELINNFPTLVLEYISGVTLSELSINSSLTGPQLREILTQINEGVVDLAQSGVFHGDLSMNNIMVDEFGGIRLIDFGIKGGGRDAYATPQYAAPQILMGRHPNLESDLVSLNLIKEELLALHQLESAKLIVEDRLKIQKEIGQLVKAIKVFRSQKLRGTQKIVSQGIKRQSFGQKLSKIVACVVLILPFMSRGDQMRIMNLASTEYSIAKNRASLIVRTRAWTRISIDDGPKTYAPLQLNLNAGTPHTIFWETAKGSGRIKMTLGAGENKILNDQFFIR